MIELKDIYLNYDHLLLKQDKIVFYPGEVTLIEGKSGCGKTALLYRLSLITVDCKINIDNHNINKLNKNDITQFRKDQISFVLQENNIISHLTVYETLNLYAMMDGEIITEKEAEQLLKKFELDITLDQKISTLSLGEKKRICIACSLIKRPKILILDEPTSALDIYNSKLIYKLIHNISRQFNCYIICTSHDKNAREYADKVYSFANQTLICTKKSKKNDLIEIKTNKAIHPQFVKKYVKLYINRFSVIHKITILMNIILLLLLIVSNVSYKNKTNLIKSKLYDQYDNVLLITPSQNEHYIDQINHYIKIDRQNLLPIYKVRIENIDNCYIIPYFHTDFIQDKINSYMGKTTNKGTFVSYDTQKELEKNLTFQQQLDISLVTYQSKDIKSFDYQLTINGTLKKGIKQYYTSQSNIYIYMYYENYYNLFQSYFTNESYCGYIQLCDNLDEVNEVKKIYTKNRYGVNDENIFYNQINNLVTYQKDTIVKLNIMICIICTLMIICFYLYSFIKRKNEYALLMLNGINNKTLLKILFYEIVLRMKYAFFILAIFVIVSLVIFQSYFTIILYVFCYFILQIILIIIIYKFLFAYLNIEKTLRD